MLLILVNGVYFISVGIVENCFSSVLFSILFNKCIFIHFFFSITSDALEIYALINEKAEDIYKYTVFLAKYSDFLPIRHKHT